MPVEFVQRHFYSILSSIPAGGMQFITDTPDPLPPGPPTTTNFRHWGLPAWFPRKVLINRAVVMYESNGFNNLQSLATYPQATADILYDLREYAYRALQSFKWLEGRTNMETMMWVDPGGLHYSAATPPGAENSDYSPLTVIMHEFTNNPMMNYDTGDFSHPIALDRDAGDKLAIQVNNGDALNWIAVDLSFLAPAPFQPS